MLKILLGMEPRRYDVWEIAPKQYLGLLLYRFLQLVFVSFVLGLVILWITRFDMNPFTNSFIYLYIAAASVVSLVVLLWTIFRDSLTHARGGQASLNAKNAKFGDLLIDDYGVLFSLWFGTFAALRSAPFLSRRTKIGVAATQIGLRLALGAFLILFLLSVREPAGNVLQTVALFGGVLTMLAVHSPILLSMVLVRRMA